MTRKPSVASRHPEVIMLYEKEEDISGAANIIAEQVDEYRTVPVTRLVGEQIKEHKPSVILFAMSTVKLSIELYTKLLKNQQIVHRHYAIVLCKNKESGLAFRSCIKGVFDNYFVYLPLYEKFRLKMIVHNGLRQSQGDDHYAGLDDDQLERIDTNLASLIELSSQCKRQLLDSVDSCKASMEQSTEQLPRGDEGMGHDKALVKSLAKQHIEPLLTQLEVEIKDGLDLILAQLTSRHSEIKDIKQKVQAKQKSRLPSQALVSSLFDEHDAKPPKKKILVVEDNQIYREMIVKVLEQDEYDTEQACDGLTALKMIKGNDYALILMDLYMPHLDGINTTKQLKVHNDGKDIPVVALTSNNNRELIKRWAQVGLKGYILKPSNRTEILQAVKTAIEYG